MTHARFDTILARQNPPRWGRHYEPAIKASREEAPPRSRPAWVWSELLQRYVSTLSEPERDVLSVLLYSPMLFELHEERMLPFLSAPHPLAGHPRADGLLLPGMRGTIAITNELGGLSFHPTLPTRTEESAVEPGCWIGDFLCFLQDDRGPYCVNFSVKQTRSAFRFSEIDATPKTDIKRAERREYVRHRTEEILYQEVGIPTRQLAADEIDRAAVANLKHLLLWQRRKHNLAPDDRDAIIDDFRTGLGRGATAFDVVCAIAPTTGHSIEQLKTVLFQAIWQRQLRIDLFSIFHMDQPMRMERRDVLDVYSTWFRREPA